MPWFQVELTGDAREVYLVAAATEDDARARWTEGTLMVSENSSMTIDSIYQTDDESL